MATEIDVLKDAEFFPERGEVNVLKTRVAIFNSHLFKSFRDSMLRIAGPVADYLIYMAAKENGREYVGHMIDKSKIARKTGLGKRYIDEQVAQILTQFGYGKVVTEKGDEDEMIFSLKNSAIATQYENSRVPVCTHIAGLVAGGATVIYGKEYDCKETECMAKGDSACRFVVKPKEDKAGNGRD